MKAMDVNEDLFNSAPDNQLLMPFLLALHVSPILLLAPPIQMREHARIIPASFCGKHTHLANCTYININMIIATCRHRKRQQAHCRRNNRRSDMARSNQGHCRRASRCSFTRSNIDMAIYQFSSSPTRRASSKKLVRRLTRSVDCC